MSILIISEHVRKLLPVIVESEIESLIDWTISYVGPFNVRR